MGKGLAMMLKALGVEITPEQAKMIEELIPQIPARLKQAYEFMNAFVKRADERFTAMEQSQQMMLQEIRNLKGGQVQDAGIEQH